MAAIIAQGPHYGDFRLFLFYFPWHNQLTICQFYFNLTAILGASRLRRALRSRARYSLGPAAACGGFGLACGPPFTSLGQMSSLLLAALTALFLFPKARGRFLIAPLKQAIKIRQAIKTTI